MRYSGSKANIAKYIIPFIMERLKNGSLYIEPFVGGCNIFDKVDWPKKIGADYNGYVIAMWNAFKNGGILPPESISLSEYTDMKELANKGSYSEIYPKWLIGYVGNACSYGSAWFNGYVKFNVKKNEDHIAEARRGLIKQLNNFKHLKESTFINTDYNEIINNAPIGSVVYCDPPYKQTKGYIPSPFNHDDFWECVRRNAKRGVNILVSEYNAPNDFTCIWSMNRSCCMSNKHINVCEKLFELK